MRTGGAVDLASKPRAGRKLTTRKKLAGIAAVAAIGLALQALSSWSASHAFMINQSESLPNWAFMVEAGRFPKRGDYVVFDPGKDPLVTKYFGAEPPAFAKITYGVPGDVVTREGNQVLVNGKAIAALKPHAKLGDALEAGPTGTIPEGCVYAGSNHKDGFDSRYAAIGFVCRDRLAGVGRAIL